MKASDDSQVGKSAACSTDEYVQHPIALWAELKIDKKRIDTKFEA